VLDDAKKHVINESKDDFILTVVIFSDVCAVLFITEKPGWLDV